MWFWVTRVQTKRLLLIGIIPLLLLGCREVFVEEKSEEYEYTMTAIQVCNYVEKNVETPFFNTFYSDMPVRQRELLDLSFDAIQAQHIEQGWWMVTIIISNPHSLDMPTIWTTCKFNEKTGRITSFSRPVPYTS